MKTIKQSNKILLIIACLLVSGNLLSILPANAQQQKKIPPEKPKLIIGIVLGQMRYDYLFRYWDKFEEGGFKRLLNEGTFCRNARYNYLFTQTSVGHATIATGAMPSVHGIIADEWYDRLKDKTMQITADENYTTVGGNVDEGKRSPVQLVSSTIGDELRFSNNFHSKVIGISLDPSSAILSAGHTASAAYWYDNQNGTWISSSYYMKDLPAWVKDFNNQKFPDLYLDREWQTLLPADQYSQSLPDDNPYEIGLNGQKTFPYNLALMSKNKNDRRNYALLPSTPFGNDFTKDFAISAIVGEELGKDDYTDLLMLSFSSSEYVGNLYGANSMEIEDVFLRLDKNLAHFFQFIDQNIGMENTLIFVTSDHGVAYVPQYLEDSGVPSGSFNQNQALALLGSYLNILYGKGEWIKSYNNQQLYLNQNLIEDSKLSMEQMQDVVAQFLVQFTGVANTVTAYTLRQSNFTSGILYKIQNGYNQKRSGDVILNLEPGWIEKSKNATFHNSSWSYDAHVPLFWYGWKINRKTINDPVDITNIAPTLANFLDILAPNGSNGMPIPDLMY